MPLVHVAHTPFVEVVAAVRPFPATQDLTVTAAHTFAFVPAFHVDPATQLEQTPLLVVVAGVRPWPVVHVLTVTASHGSLPEAENVEPATHAAALAAGRTARRYAATKSLSSNLAICVNAAVGAPRNACGARALV